MPSFDFYINSRRKTEAEIRTQIRGGKFEKCILFKKIHISQEQLVTLEQSLKRWENKPCKILEAKPSREKNWH